MNTYASFMQSKTDEKVSPFQQIAECETREDQRLQTAIQKLKDEEIKEEESILKNETKIEEEHRTDIQKGLLVQKDAIKKEMMEAEKSIQKELAALDSAYAKNSPAVIDREVASFLSLAS